ncbi:DUF4179 domain-containing protein [Evansella sp. AB-rgal1]|uniref:DUF4179 domain-containing protein n=1 Tax=Evansella sp. AB-rgal1 TaxID=3242696 RepID=UPI00359EC1C7
MKNIEDELNQEKQHIEKLKAPMELETRLRGALDNKRRRAPFKWMSLAAAVFLIVMVVGMNYNTFAYYGKILTGFDDITTGSLKAMNELGMGQVVDKTIKVDKTTELTVDGIISDANQMIVYYTLVDSSGELEEKYHAFFPTEVTGWMTDNYVTWATGMFNEEGTEFKGIASLDPPNPFAKNLTLHYRETLSTGEEVYGSVSFPYNPSAAIESVIKQNVRGTVKVDKGKIKFDSITASPMSTTITGSMDVDNYSRINLGLSGVKLLVDGKEVPQTASGSRSGITGNTKFAINFEGLPDEFTSLELYVNTFVGYKQVDKEVNILPLESEIVYLRGEELWIKDVDFGPEQVEITIASEDTFLLHDVFVGDGEEKTPLQTTKNHTYTELEDGTSLRVRTMVFPTDQKVNTLYIGGVHYEKEYNQIITIPVK